MHLKNHNKKNVNFDNAAEEVVNSEMSVHFPLNEIPSALEEAARQSWVLR